jgi:Spy/CpxP family protein refolding chaperone
MKTPARSRLLAAALFALGVSTLPAQPATPAGGPPDAAPDGGGARRAGGGRGGGGGRGNIAVAPGAARGRGGPGAPAVNPLTIENLTTALTLTDTQVAAIRPLLEQITQAQQDQTTKQAAAAAATTEMRSRLAPVFTDAQKKFVAVRDLLGTYNDRAYMMEQLGIARLRPGKDAPPDQSVVQPGFDLANAHPWKDTMPALMKMQNGTPVTRADQWPARRKEILELFEREVYGRIPANVPKVTWVVTSETQGNTGGIPTITRQLQGRVDNSAYPAITVNIQASFTIPANATGPVPIFLSFGGGAAAQAIPRGWGSGSIQPGSIQADSGGNSLRQGIIGLTNKGQPRKPDDWGSLRAWGWGVSKLIDYFEANPTAGVNPRAVSIEGVSRFGKAALVTMAFDERVATALVASSGEGGAKLHRHDYGEAVENLTDDDEYHWMSASFLKYGAAEATFGKKDAGDIPVDSHQLIALCAPRPCFISYGVPPGDPAWVDAPGSYMATILASPAYEVLGKKGVGVNPADYITAPLPAVQQLVGGELAWRQHEGGHTSGPNIVPFLDWIATYIKAPALRQ